MTQPEKPRGQTPDRAARWADFEHRAKRWNAVLASGGLGMFERADRHAMLEMLAELRALAAEHERYREALEAVKLDCEVCNWRCERCDYDPTMTETDLYNTAVRALAPAPNAEAPHTGDHDAASR